MRRIPPFIGLIVTMTGVWTLSRALATFLQFVPHDTTSVLSMTGLDMLTSAFQLATGLAIIRERPVARVLLVLWSVVLLGSGAYQTLEYGQYVEPLPAAIVFLQHTSPIVFAWLAPFAAPTEASRRSELAATLVVLAVASVLGQGLWVGTTTLMWGVAPGKLAYDLCGVAASLVTLGCAVHAARQLESNTAAAARRALKIYVIVALVVAVIELGLRVVGMIMVNTYDALGLSPLVGPVIGTFTLGVLWSYAQPELATTSDDRPGLVSTPVRAAGAAWAALWMVPQVACVLLLLVVGAVKGLEIPGWLLPGIGLVAVSLLLSGLGTLRAWRTAKLWALLGVALAVGWAALLFVDVTTMHERILDLASDGTVTPPGILRLASSLLAWLLAVTGVLYWRLRPTVKVPAAIIRR